MMKSRRASILSQLDWPTLMLVIALVTLGWLNIVSATAEAEVVWDLGGKAGKQLIWMGVCTVLMTGLLAVEGEFYIRTSVLHYLVVLALLAAVLVVGKKVGGARSWFGVGSFGIQPSEFAKTATSLMVAWYLSRDGRPWRTLTTRLQSLAIIAIPCGPHFASTRCRNGARVWRVCLCALPRRTQRQRAPFGGVRFGAFGADHFVWCK